ncbi:hypothetical protein AAC387_Pa10g0183 [Persea americana]
MAVWIGISTAMATASSTFSKPLLPNNHRDHNNHDLILLWNAQSPRRMPTVRSPSHRVRPPIRSFSLPVSTEEAPATNPSALLFLIDVGKSKVGRLNGEW